MSISELAWAGSSVSSADEWVELANSGSSDIDLTGWELWDTAVDPPKRMLRIPSGILPAGSNFLIANNAANHVFSHGESVLAIPPDVVDAAVMLSNSSLGIELRDAAGNVIDRAGNGATPLAGSTIGPATMVRVDANLDGTDPASWKGAASQANIDPGLPDLGTPQASGRVPIQSVSESPTVHKSEEPAAPISGSLADVLEATTTSQRWRIEALVAVSQGTYDNRRLIIRDGNLFAELQLPSESRFPYKAGAVVRFVGHHSTAAMPRVLWDDDQSVEQLGQSTDRWVSLDEEAAFKPPMFVELQGNVATQDRQLILSLAHGSVKLSSRQGVSLAGIAGKQIIVRGVVVTDDPPQVRVLTQDDLEILTSETPDVEPSEADSKPESEDQADVKSDQGKIPQNSAAPREAPVAEMPVGKVQGAYAASSAQGLGMSGWVGSLTLLWALGMLGDLLWERIRLRQHASRHSSS